MNGARPWVLGFVVVLVVAAVVVLRSPVETTRRPLPLPLAATTVPAGEVGGLLPDVTLRGRVRADRARDLRPGVLMLVSADCGCAGDLRRVVAAAARVRLVTYVVEAGDSLRQPEILAAQAGGEVGPYADPGGTLAAAYHLHTHAALVLVRRDGVVTQVVAAVSPSLRLATELRALVARGASPAGR